jgi:phenylalanyl-tRNA synthetase beta chain
MHVSKKWIEDFVSLPQKSKEVFASELTIQTVEVDEAISQEEMLSNIVVGEVTSIEKHPNADTLHICQVSVGEEILPVVCGGSNLFAGMKVAMGMIGATVRWHGEGDLVALKKTKIRGEVSLGMICAAEEIGLGDLFPKKDEKEILDLSHLEVSAGTALAAALQLDDVVFDIDNKSMTHRPDLWGHYGVAREFAALYNTDLKSYEPAEVIPGTDVAVHVTVEDSVLCPRYMAVQLSGIKIASSPDWMQKRLMAVGVRPINNIVDITNYVMFELGQPMHAFDADVVDVSSVAVRNAKQGEKITLLGGDEYELSDSMLVIADAKNALAVAGVKGGENSGVTEKTTNILFEVANFHALSVRRASAKIAVRTDASSRFEKGLDPTLPEIAMKKAVELTLQLCPDAKVVSNIADVQSFTVDQGPITITADKIRSRIGVDISDEKIVQMLEHLGFIIKQESGNLIITIPTWRATGDVSIPEDIIEEVARMYGYDNIAITFPQFPITPAPASPLRDVKKHIKQLLAYESGYTEVYNYSFVSPEWLEKLGIGTEEYIELAHPLAKDRPFIRRGLIPNMLVGVESNLHRFESVRLFETGRGYKKEQQGELAHPDGDAYLPGQDEYLGMVYSQKGVDTPFFELSDSLRFVADRLGLSVSFESVQDGKEYLHGGRHADVFFNDVLVGFVAELHPVTQKAVGIPYRTAVLEINLSVFAPFVKDRIAYTSLPAYPSVDRDIAFVVDASVQDANIRKVILHVDKKIVAVDLFDVYAGEHVEAGKKSVAYHLTYRSETQTLTSEEVEVAHAKVVAVLGKKFGAEIRK